MRKWQNHDNCFPSMLAAGGLILILAGFMFGYALCMCLPIPGNEEVRKGADMVRC